MEEKDVTAVMHGPGLYGFAANTAAGKAWVLDKIVTDDGETSFFVEGTDRANEILVGMQRDGLTVEVVQ